MDATCAPADIRYPTDVNLLNAAREKTEEIIDVLHKPHKGKKKKVRTYRQKARKDYLSVAKKRHPSMKKVRQGIRKQLQYISRNLRHIEKLGETEIGKERPLAALNKRMYKNLLVVSEVYRQQEKMYREKSRKTDGRIVSIDQPHVRPIVRGKAGTEVEFGAKISVAMVEGYAFLEKLSWEAYNEAGDLKAHIEKYKQRFGYYPKSVHVDAIYRNRENRRYCKERNITISGPPLGRPPKKNAEYQRVMKHARESELDRIPIEGKFGNAKRKYGMDKIMSKLKETAETSISLTVLVMNLEKISKDFLLSIFFFVSKTGFALRKCVLY